MLTYASKQQVVEMNLRLNMDFQTAGQEGSTQRQIFINDLKQDLAHASGTCVCARARVRACVRACVYTYIRIYVDTYMHAMYIYLKQDFFFFGSRFRDGGFRVQHSQGLSWQCAR